MLNNKIVSIHSVVEYDIINILRCAHYLCILLFYISLLFDMYVYIYFFIYIFIFSAI